MIRKTIIFIALFAGTQCAVRAESEAGYEASSEASYSASSEAQRGGSSEAQWGTSSSEAQWGGWNSEASLHANSESGYWRPYGANYGYRGYYPRGYMRPGMRGAYRGGPPQMGPPDPSSIYATRNRLRQDEANQVYHEIHLASEPISDFVKTYGSTQAPQTISTTTQTLGQNGTTDYQVTRKHGVIDTYRRVNQP